MSKVSIFDQGWLDLVFEGRNKSYGAYQLRRQDSKTTVIALFSGIALIGALVALPLLFGPSKEKAVTTIPEVLPPIKVIVPFEQTKKPDQPRPKTIEPAVPAPAPSAPTTALKRFEATSHPVENPPTNAVLANTNPGTTTTAGTGEEPVIGPTSAGGLPSGSGTGPTATTPPGDGTFIVGTLDENPEFPGGLKKFTTLVGRNFSTPEIDKQTTVKVLVSFVVERDGTMTDIRVLKDPGYGLANEAVRALKSIKTKWKPGKKGGQAVRTAYSLPITVNIN